MWKVIKDIYTLISKQNKFKFKILILLVFLMSLFEIIGLALILPFLYLVNNLDKATTNPYINNVFTYFNFQDTLSFLYSIGAIAIMFSFFGMILSIYTNMKLSKFSNDLGVDFSIKLLKYYMGDINPKDKPDIRKEKRKKILTETTIVSHNIILPSLMIISKTILILVLFSGLLIINYTATLSLIFILMFIYMFIFHFSNKRVKENLKKIESLKQEKNLLINDVLMGKTSNEKEESEIVKKYFTKSYALSRHQSFNNVISKLPRYLMMFLVFSFIVLLSTYLVNLNQGDMSNVMPKMLLFIVIGLKLLPQIQNVFINYLKLKSNSASFTNIKDVLFEAGK